MQMHEIQWFPGHMAKTKRLMQESLQDVDVVFELLDARIPYSSRNPDIKNILGTKPTITILNKATLADPNANRKWKDYFEKEGIPCVLFDCTTGDGMKELQETIGIVLKEKIERYKQKGMEGRRLKAMICGIPNVGKSSLINRLAGGKHAKVENRPGVTLTKQWVSTTLGLSLLDMPGVLWPKFDEKRVGENLAFTGAIRDQILDKEEIAMLLCDRLLKVAPTAFCQRYKLDYEEVKDLDCYDVFEMVGRKRGFLVSGGNINGERTAEMLLEEFRSAKIGRITLEYPNVKGE